MQRSPQQTATLILYIYSARLTLSFSKARGHTLGEMAVDIMFADMSENGEVALLSGDQTSTTDDYRCQRKDTDYYLIYFSYDQPYDHRSEVHLVSFHTAAV